jgi:hypothetical protein
MGLDVHVKTAIGGFEYVLVGRGTTCVRYDGERVSVDSFRSLLAASERDEQRSGVTVVQTAWYLPRLTVIDDPIDLGNAATSYLERHGNMLAAHVVAPSIGLIRIVVDMLARGVEGFDARMYENPDDATYQLRQLEPDLPRQWYDLGLYPSSGVRPPSLRPPSMAPASVPRQRVTSRPPAPPKPPRIG